MSSILLINNSYPTKKYPNASTYVQSIKDLLVEIGVDVELLVIERKSIKKSIRFLQYILFAFKFYFVKLKTYNYYYIHHYPYMFYVLILRLFVVKKSKIIIHWHGSDLASKSWYMLITHFFIGITGIKKFKHIVPSEYFRDKLCRKFGIRTSNITVSPSGGVNIAIFTHKNQSSANIKYTLGFASGLQKAKGFGYVLKLIKQIEQGGNLNGHSIGFKIINYSVDEEYNNLNLNKFKCCQVLSPIPKSEMPSFYHSIDILLFPTSRESESLGLVALEAMACGVPVVGTSNFAIPEYIIPNKSGELFKQNDFDDFTNSILRVIKNYNDYNPRDIIQVNYSNESVKKYYKEQFLQ
ncbi:MAG TPA: glycosyltransferase family 4 protein [Epulopiscium sp.]|nr:glycosyltransferase family 4 protein [Candidatus Epulonipiscium sp.]